MRKVIVILLISSSFRTLVSCCKDVGFNFRWSKAIISNINIPANTSSPLTIDSSKIVNYGFRLNFEFEQVGYNFINNFGLNETYALKCVTTYLNKDSITKIDVITQNNFDNTHPAGSSIDDYLLTLPGSMYFGQVPYQYKPIKDNINYLNEAYSINNNILDFKFKNIAPFLGQHKFIVTILFRSGRTLSSSTAIKLY